MLKQNHISFSKKAFAFIIDILILNLFILTGFRGILQNIIPQQSFNEMITYYNEMAATSQTAVSLTLISFIIGLLFLFYFSLSEYLAGATIGMLVLNIRAVDKERKNPGLMKSITRNLFCLPFFPFIILWIIDPLFLIFRKEDQRFMEYITQTKIISDR